LIQGFFYFSVVLIHELDQYRDKIRNDSIRERVGVASVLENMVETRLRWFGHLERRHVDSLVRRVDHDSQVTRGRGRPRKTIKKDLEINELNRNLVYDKPLCRCLSYVADPT